MPTDTLRRGRWLLAALLAVAALLVAAGPAAAQIRATLIASGFSRPVGFVQHPSDPTVQLVIEQAGRIRVLRAGQVQSPDFLDLVSDVASAGEQGLLGLAFAPDFTTSGRVFVNFTNRSGHTVIARFTTVVGNALRVDPTTRFDLVWPNGDRFITQPFTNHNGGHIAFGPDGFLYIGMGDGGSGNDPMHLAQNPRSLLGKFLRLDVAVPASDPEGYNIPPTNPFAGRADVLGEIWSFGLRNPWRWSFDNSGTGGTGALVIADVGQSAWEEINYEPANSGGRNYGWRNREGAHNHVTSSPPFSQPLRDPIHEYPRSLGQSITGGYVYRGRLLGPSFAGRYFFADFIANRVWSMAIVVDPASREGSAANVIEHTAALGAAAVSPASFGVDAAGDLYLVSYAGSVFRLEGSSSTPGRARNGAVVGTARPR
jgi:glucose/arabinose dehydrogenase